MPGKSTFIFLLAALVLAACAPATPRPTPTLPSVTAASLPTADKNTSSDGNCTLVSQKILPTPNPTEAVSLSLFKPVSDADWILGDKNAPITFLEYSDFECPYCAPFAPILKQLQQDYPQDVRVVFRHFPLESHQNAPLAAQAAEAAGLQGKFWEMHDALFTSQGAWAGLDAAAFETWLNQEASTLSLDTQKFSADLKSAALVTKIADARQEGLKIGIPGTPFVLIDGKIWQGPRDIDNLKAVVELLKLEKRQLSGCPPQVIDPRKSYSAVIQTEKGEIDVQLFADRTPITVNNFVFLARQGWFNGIIFHRVIQDFVAQTGDPSGTGYGGPGYAFKDEIVPDLKFDKPGMLGMANAGADSNGSQFFITLTAQSQLDGTYTVFGQVTKGMDVVKQLTPRDPSKTGQPLPAGDKIISVTILEK